MIHGQNSCLNNRRQNRLLRLIIENGQYMSASSMFCTAALLFSLAICINSDSLALGIISVAAPVASATLCATVE